MKSTIYLFIAGVMICFGTFPVRAQVEIKGTGTTSATQTFITRDAAGVATMTVRDDGNVGIGTTTPVYKLDVNGPIGTSGGYVFPDGTMQITAASTVPYANVFTVATAGGDFTSIQAAINACVAPSKNNPYLVRVMPGVYADPLVNCRKFVDLRGSGKYSCYIIGTVIGEDSCLIENFFIMRGVVCNMKSPFILHNIITRTDIDNATGIFVTGPARPWIKENEILDCNGFGIVCDQFGADAWIIANQILRNGGGGVRCNHSSPTISNNFIDHNQHYGIYVMGAEGTPSEPTIDDNVIGHTSQFTQGIGIAVNFFAEPRIIANDIYLNGTGIEIDPPSQPSILSNNINYNEEAGIRCFSPGASKRVVIQGNHIHSNTGPSGFQSAGIYVSGSNPMITHNNVTQNRRGGSFFPDIDYSTCIFPMLPTISVNIYDFITGSIPAAPGQYNSTAAGGTITP